MKLSKNPYVIGGLALVAVILLWQTTLWPLIKRSRWNSRTASVGGGNVLPLPVTPPPSPSPQPSAEAPRNSLSSLIALSLPMDVSALSLNLVQWTESSPRDPFRILSQVIPGTTTTNRPPSAMQQLTLKGIWQQTGSSLVVVNDQILSQGETILAYRIDSIETNRIWVQGPNGLEAVDFKASAESDALLEEPRPTAADPRVTK